MTTDTFDLQVAISEIKGAVNDLDEAIRGNGKQGLNERVSLLEDHDDNLAKALTDISDELKLAEKDRKKAHVAQLYFVISQIVIVAVFVIGLLAS